VLASEAERVAWALARSVADLMSSAWKKYQNRRTKVFSLGWRGHTVQLDGSIVYGLQILFVAGVFA
jgi:hypothetical protein